MGVFHTLTEIINRTAERITIRFDGQDKVIEPNYDVEGNLLPDVQNMVPDQVVPYALNQCVIMGSEQFEDPSDFRSRIGIPIKARVGGKKRKEFSWNDCSFLGPVDETDINTLTRVPISEVVDDPTAKVLVRGSKKRKSADPVSKDLEPFALRN